MISDIPPELPKNEKKNDFRASKYSSTKCIFSSASNIGLGVVILLGL